MSRPFRELLDDYEADPSRWEVARTDVVPSSNLRNRGGSSVQEVLRHRDTGEELVRHTLLTPDGDVFAAPHFRPQMK